jgi:hypothetical protein
MLDHEFAVSGLCPQRLLRPETACNRVRRPEANHFPASRLELEERCYPLIMPQLSYAGNLVNCALIQFLRTRTPVELLKTFGGRDGFEKAVHELQSALHRPAA